jgi:hypothetical protein
MSRAFQNPNFKMRRAASARQYTKRSVSCRRKDSSVMSINGSILVVASFLDSCLALTQSRLDAIGSKFGREERAAAWLMCTTDISACDSQEEEGVRYFMGKSRTRHPMRYTACSESKCRTRCLDSGPRDTVIIAGGAELMGNWQKYRALNLTTSKHDFPWFAPSVALDWPAIATPASGIAPGGRWAQI